MPGKSGLEFTNENKKKLGEKSKADKMRDYVGKYFSVEYVRKNVLRQTERDIEDIDKQIKKEIDDGIIAMPDAGEFTREVK